MKWMFIVVCWLQGAPNIDIFYSIISYPTAEECLEKARIYGSIKFRDKYGPGAEGKNWFYCVDLEEIEENGVDA